MKFSTTIRIAGPIVLISLLLLIVGVSGAWYVQRLQRQTSDVLNHNVASIRAAEELNVYLLQIRFELNKFLIGGNHDRIDQVKILKPQVDEWLNKASRLANSSEEQKAIEVIRDRVEQLFSKLNQTTLSSDQSILRQNIEILVEEELSNLILPAAANFLNISEQELEASSSENTQFANRLVLVLFLLGTCGSISGLIVGYGVATAISRSIVKLTMHLKDVAGQLNEVVGPITMSADLEIEDIEIALLTISDEIATVIEQLHDRQRELIRSDQLAALGQLSAGLAHELRNPLMCISVLVQSALSDHSRALDEKDLRVIDVEMQRLDRLLQEFLNFARPTDTKFTRVDIHGLAVQTVELLESKAGLVGIKIKVNSTTSPIFIYADDKQMRQLIINLLLNAIDASPTEGTVELCLSIDPINSHYCILVIQDEGSGLVPEALNRAFDPFFSTKTEGLGMGLVTCRRIVEAHQGEIAIANGVEAGAVITVRIPMIITGILSTGEGSSALASCFKNGE